MDRLERDRKKRRKALDRVEKAAQLFEVEFLKAQRNKGYSPDLEDLEELARYFEGAAKTMSRLNKKALKRGIQNEIQ
jgi:hypothetical protein